MILGGGGGLRMIIQNGFIVHSISLTHPCLFVYFRFDAADKGVDFDKAIDKVKGEK